MLSNYEHKIRYQVAKSELPRLCLLATEISLHLAKYEQELSNELNMLNKCNMTKEVFYLKEEIWELKHALYACERALSNFGDIDYET